MRNRSTVGHVGFLPTHFKKRRQRRSRGKQRFGATRLQAETLEARVVLTSDVVISEFQADNDTTLVDEENDFEDWIELHNTSLDAVNLDGWYLTDSADNLTKWRIPDVTLGDDEFLVVFASNKDSNDPDSNLVGLHTNFQLSAGGEFLALVEPDGLTIASEYSPEYPEQLPDQSYGLAVGRDTVLLLDNAAAATALVPANNSLGTTWTEVGFDDGSWLSGTTAVGFEQLASGFSARDDFDADLGPEWTVDIPAGGTSTYLVEGGKLKVDLPGGQNSFGDRGLAPMFLQDAPQLKSNYEIITQVTLTTGMGAAGLVVTDGTTGAPAFSLQYDRTSGFISQIRTISGDSVLNTRVQFNETSVFLRIERDLFADTWTTSFKLAAGDDWEELLVATEGIGDVPQTSAPQIGLIARTPTTALPVEFDFFELNVGDERPVYGPQTGLDVEASMFAENNASVYVRVPFTVAGDASRFDEMDLAIEYDDGFIAYLNGVEIERRFVPIESSWDSAASGSHGAVDGQIPTEVINLNAHVGLLTEGENVLAFQGMNVAADDGDFYLNPTLNAAEILSTSPQVFLVPTPGMDNTLPAAPQPVFSESGGTFIGSKIVEITNPDPGANFQIRYTTNGTEPSVTSPLYTGPLTFTDSTWLRARIFDTSFNQAFSPSNTTAAAYIALNQSLANRDSDLPILVLDTLGQGFPQSSASNLAPGLVALFDTDPVTGRATMVDGNLDYSGLGGARRRGSSTGGNTKPPLKFETWGAFDDDFDVPLLGMPANSDWVLYAPFNFDRTLIHEPFIYSLSNDLGSYASRTIPIEVYANVNGGVVDANDYYGVYILMERIKQGNGRVDIADADPNATYDPSFSVFDQPDEAITGGYLWKIDRGDPGEPPFSAGGYSINWQYPANHSDPSTSNAQQVTPDQQAYVSAYINEFGNVLDGPNAYDPVDGYAKYIDVDGWIDNHLFNIITMNVDAQRLSAYFHKDAGEKLTYGPVWDFDRALESTDGRDDDPLEWRGKGGDLGTDFFGESGNGMGGRWWRQLFDDPNFFQAYIDRYWELRAGDGLFSNAAIDARVDYWADIVRESSERNINDVPGGFRQSPRSSGCHGVAPGEPSACNGTWQGEVENMRAWLHRRLQFMDDTFPVNPTVSLDGAALPVLPQGISVSPGAEVTGFVPDKPDPVMLFDDTVLLSGEPGTVPITYFVPGDNSLGDTWAAVDFDDGAWDAGTNGIGYQNASVTDYTDLITTTVKPRDVVNGAATLMTRTEFTIDDPAAIDDLVLQVKYDDNYIAYLNGTEVARKGITEAPSWNQGAGSHANSAAVEYEDVDISAFKDLVVAGNNVLAIHVINSTVDVLFDLGIGDMFLVPQVVSREVTVLPNDPGGVLYYTTDGSDPRGLDGEPTAAASVLGREDSIVITENTQVIMRNLDEIDHGPQSNLVTTDWSAPRIHNFIVEPVELTITEINYNPADPSADELAAIPGVGNDDYEFVEILNAGNATMDLTGVELSDGVSFNFTTGAISSLGAGEYLLVVRDQAAFESRYGAGLPIAGEYDGSLSNTGERLTLADGLGNSLHSTEYSDGRLWPQTADGVGATLELVDPEGTPAELSDKYYAWRGSTDIGGSPGSPGTDPAGVVINELLAHSDPPQLDSIELLNTTGSPINIGGWYLSDAAGDLQKFEIPADTILGAGAYIVFDESNFNMDGDENGFGLSSGSGDDVWLTIPDGNGGTGSFVDDVHFIASLAGESFGREPNGEGVLAPMLSNTFGGDNSVPRVGPLIISEVNYNPGAPSAAALAIAEDLTADDLEFVEIHNPTAAEVDLTDWRLRGAVDDTIADGTMIGAGETVVLISFNPDDPDNVLRLDAFRAHYGINESVRLLGGYNGELSDNGELVELQRADHPEPAQPLVVAHVSEDFVIYDNLAPWPTSANGTGSSLQRSAPSLYGNSASSWIATTPSPGTAAFGDRPGDFNDDDTVDAEDINILFGAISTGNMAAEFDLNNSGTVDQGDVQFLVENIIGTSMGDANLDGKVDPIDLNQVGINWRRMDGAGWSNGDFTGDGAVDAQDLNLIGINWRSGAAAAQGRVPRAPLAAVQHAPVAILDVAIDQVGTERRVATRDTLAAASDNESVEYGFELKRSRYDAGSFRRDSVQRSDTADQVEDDEARLVDDLFAEL